MQNREEMELDVESLVREFELYENPVSEKHKAILAAAEKLFSEKGFDGSPTSAIAKEAGVTERTLFKHFPTKNGLLKRLVFGAIVKTILPVQLKRMRAYASAPYETFREFAMTLAADRLKVAQAHHPRLRLLLLELFQNDGFRTQFVKLWKKHIWVELIKTIEKFQKKGELRSDVAPEVVAQLMLSTVLGYVISRYVLRIAKPANAEQELEILLSTVLTGLNKSKAR